MSERLKFKFHIKTGDTVKVLSGADRNATGRVLSVDRKKYRAFVEGVNLVTKHQKPNAQNPDGGRIEQEASIHISNLMLIDPKSGEPTRVGRRRDDGGKIKRYSKKTGEFID